MLFVLATIQNGRYWVLTDTGDKMQLQGEITAKAVPSANVVTGT